MKDPQIADAAEVLRMLTGVMRGDTAEAKVSERCKAAEDLAKHYGLFDTRETKREPRPAVARAIDEAIREVKRRAQQGSD